MKIDIITLTSQLAEELPNTPIYRSSTTTLPSTTTSTLPPRRELSTGGLTTDPEVTLL